MEQLSLLEPTQPDIEKARERQRRREEIRNPLLLARRSAADILRLLLISGVMAFGMLATLRLFYGSHPAEEEVVVLSTPLVILYLFFRLLRTVVREPDETATRERAIRLSLQDALVGLFALGIVFLGQTAISLIVYKCLGLEWAVDVAWRVLALTCFAMTFLGTAIFFNSPRGKQQFATFIRFAMTLPRWMLPSLTPASRLRFHL